MLKLWMASWTNIQYSIDKEVLLIMEYQDVGKNRVVEYHREREYLQWHQETTTFFTVH